MDRDHVMLVAGITIAAVIGSFILWGPSTVSRSKKRGTVIGLQNLGLTCYLNSLLQALSSCQYFIDWLNNQKYEGEVAKTMKELLSILSGNVDVPSEQIFVSPIEVVHALNHAGWTITNSQQDVHELLCNLLNILEDEGYKACSDLNIGHDAIHYHGLNNLVSSSRIPLSSTAHPVPNGGFDSSEKYKTSHEDLNSMLTNYVLKQEPTKCNYQNGILPQTSNFVTNLKAQNCEKINGNPRRCFTQDLSQNPKPSPFRGYLMNRIECTRCNYKSVLRYDKFDIISLHLPESSGEPVIYNLLQLLDNFIKHEMITDVTCEGCNKDRTSTESITAPAIKLLRFGKLPPCLCLHIVRTSFHEFGVYKRQDYVDFPEYIIMDPYVYKPTRYNSFTADQTLLDLWKQGTNQQNINSGNGSSGEKIHKHIYRLKSVIVHRGSHNDGHFMTYRRGLSSRQDRSNERRWYLVSDMDVKETTLFSVLSSVAYVLFYEKCSTLA